MPKSHTLEPPFTVVSLADLDLAGYRIHTGGTEGCFDDLHNDRLVTLYGISGPMNQLSLVC